MTRKFIIFLNIMILASYVLIIGEVFAEELSKKDEPTVKFLTDTLRMENR